MRLVAPLVSFAPYVGNAGLKTFRGLGFDFCIGFRGEKQIPYRKYDVA